MLQTSKFANPNYLAKVVRITKIRKHSNADRLQCVTIDGNNVITGSDIKEGDVYVYFPLECTINKDFLSWSNSFRDPKLNANPEIKGFFEEHGRVKAIKLRGEKSEGYIVPVSDIARWLLETTGKTYTSFIDGVGQEFDSVDDIIICKKYVPKVSQTPGQGGSKDRKVVKRISRLVEGQFRLHEDTHQLRKNIHQINPDDLISVTYKLHGTSFVVASVLGKKKLKLIDRIAKRLGVSVIDTEYDIFYSSRKVVKNEFETKNHQHYYKYDLWGEIKEQLKDSIQKGITLYGEAVGYLKDGGYIQKDYDYGCKPGEFQIYIYRITQTNVDGKVIEFSWPQIVDYCTKFGLNHVPVFYYGKAKDMYPTIANPDEETFRDAFLQSLEADYMERNCYMCRNKVPTEGVVVRKEKTFEFEAYKLKCFNFLSRESKLLDENVVDLETAESVS